MKPIPLPHPFLPSRLTACLLALLALAHTSIATASDAATATKLRALGAQVTEAAGAVTRVVFKDCSKLGDAEFRDLGQLKSLKALTLYGKCHGLTDQTLPHLAGLGSLEELGTDGIQVTDAGLAALTTLTNLRSASFFHIAFPDKGFTGAGFAAFKTLPKLERLTVAGTPFNDRGMAAIGQLTQLKEFSTWHTYQTQAGNEHLLTLKNLRSLKLGQRLRRYDGKPNLLSLDDSTLATVAKLTSLENLSLDEVRLTHTGLSALKALPTLKKLTLLRTDITEADLAKLRTDLPAVTIDWKPLTDAERTALNGFLKP
ncbi:hypothetical protein LBMAG56_25190 [Verrucomicrobiota bacterium]|nr:hypothetical protein LBMAG56_25190 [Verrucomicrobiota bacterium]